MDIFLGTDEHRVNDEAVVALAREPDIYQRGGMLVHLIEQDADSGDEDIVRREPVRPWCGNCPSRCSASG